MRLTPCTREPEIRRLLELGQWPAACPADLRAHAAACSSCSSLVLLTQAFRSERTQAAAAAHLQSPGALWWRAQLRRRNAALERMQRPLLGAQVFAVAFTLVAAVVLLVWEFKGDAAQSGPGAKVGLDWFGWLADLPRALHFEGLLPTALQNTTGVTLLAIAACAAIALLSGMAVYSTSDKR